MYWMLQMKRWIFLLLSGLLVVSPSSGETILKRLYAGAAVGFGLPKLPPSQFYNPISITGTGMIRLQIHDKYVLKTDGAALTSFSIGTVNGRKGTLRFDLQYISLAIARRWKGEYGSAAYYFLGAGQYHLNQQINEKKDNLYTFGMNLGVEYVKKHTLLSTVFGLNWHLLFRPSSNPQVLMLSFGLLL